MKPQVIAASCAYVALAGSAWTLDLISPAARPAADQQPFVLLLVVALALLARSPLKQGTPPLAWRPIASGLLLFGLPSLLLPVSARGLPVFTRVALLALIPAMVVLLTTVRDRSDSDLLRLLGPALAGLGGALLLLPADPSLLLEHPSAAVAMAAAILSITVGSYTAHAASKALPIRAALVLMLAPSFALIALTSHLTHTPTVAPALRDLPALLWGAAEISLLVYLLGILPPVVVSARYLLIPLLTSIEGLALLRPSISPRMLLGGALLLAASAALILRGSRQPESPRSLLG